MSKLLKTTLMAAAAAVTIGAFGASANADPITFTWNPANVPGVSGAGPITATNIIVSDFANASITNATGAFTESGVLWVQNFQLNGAGTPAPGLNNGSGGTYQMFFTFSASGNGSFSGGNFNGSVNALNFSLVLDQANNDSITNQGGGGVHTLVDPTGNDVVLANGSIANGPTPNQVNIINGIPGASSTATFVPTAAAIADNFFVSPAAAAYLALVIEDTFTNTAGVETVTPGVVTTAIDIHGGGGNADFTVPEPASLSIFGAGLLAFGFLKRRRNKQA